MSQIETTLRQLRLSGLLQTLGVRLQEAAAGRLGHGEFLELILQDETQRAPPAHAGQKNQSRRLPRFEKPR